MSLEEFLQSAREGELEIERMSDMLLRLDARAKRVTAVYRQSGGTKGDGPEAIWMQLAEQREKLTQRIHNGAVVLLHNTSATNAAVLDRVLTAWEADGYQFGTLDELFAD